MKTYVKISDYRCVVDTEAFIEENDYYLSENVIYKSTFDGGYPRTIKDKIIATTNPNLPLPQITNPTEELVGKEVEVEIVWGLHENYIQNEGLIAILKPISKETPTNETLEEVALNYCSNENLVEFSGSSFELEVGKQAFIAGYKHCEKTRYSGDEVKELCNKAYNLGLSSNKSEILDLEEMMEFDIWFNNNKK